MSRKSKRDVRLVGVKTHILHQRISSPLDAPGVFARASDESVPLVLVPDDRWTLSCCTSVPSGVFAIKHRFGKDANPLGLADAGLLCAPSCTRIAYCVSAQACTYNAPVKSTPTSDNVMVDCDLTLVFQIGPSPEDVKTFVYTLGAPRFDEFLAAAVEESIRHLIRTCNHTEVYELRGGNDIRIIRTLKELNKKFSRFGVSFLTAAITDVRFSPELQQTLQDTTNFKSKINEEEKKHHHAMDRIQFDNDNKMEQVLKRNERVIQDMQAARTRAEIDRGKLITEAQSRAEVEKTRAIREAKTNETRAKAHLTVADNQAQSRAEEVRSKAKSSLQTAKISVDQECKALIHRAEQELEAAKNICQALQAEAEAEELASAALRVKREHDLRMAKMEVLQAVARNSKIVVSGDVGERLIDALLDQKILSQ